MTLCACDSNSTDPLSLLPITRLSSHLSVTSSTHQEGLLRKMPGGGRWWASVLAPHWPTPLPALFPMWTVTAAARLLAVALVTLDLAQLLDAKCDVQTARLFLYYCGVAKKRSAPMVKKRWGGGGGVGSPWHLNNHPLDMEVNGFGDVTDDWFPDRYHEGHAYLDDTYGRLTKHTNKTTFLQQYNVIWTFM